jgi:hypothetical protein
MKRMHFFALSGAIATATIALGIGDASAEYRRGAVGVAAYDNLYAQGVYRRTARRAYRRAAYTGAVAPGIGAGWNGASYVGLGWGGTARRAYRRAAYTGAVAPGIGVGWNRANYVGLPGWGGARALAVGAAAASNAASYGAYGDNYGAFHAGTFRRTGEAYFNASPALARAAVRRIAFVSPGAAAAWASYPTRAEFVRGYVTPGYAGYYGPRCNPLVDLGCY